MTLNWVIGRGGLLGSALARGLYKSEQQEFIAAKIRWGTASALVDLSGALDMFLASAGTNEWQIYWCAGAGVTDSKPEELKKESDLVGSFLRLLASKQLSTHTKGGFLFCSSAGALYGGSSEPPFTENTIPQPLGEYGTFKIKAEAHVMKFSESSTISTAIARIANLYGPGQSLSKQQGILSRLASATLTNKPVSIYVPLDTLRDYIFVDDCATKLLLFAEKSRENPIRNKPHIKIIASGTSYSLGEVLGTFKRVQGKNPLVVMKESAVSALQSKDLRLKSTYWQELDKIPVTGLLEGVSITRRDLELKMLQPGHFSI